MVNCISASQFKQFARQRQTLGSYRRTYARRVPVGSCDRGAQFPADRLDPAAIQAARNGTAHEPLFVVCRSGARGKQACERFIAAGYDNVINVEGGTTACDLLESKW